MAHVLRIIFTLLALSIPGMALAANPVMTAVVDAGSGGTRLLLYKVITGPYPEIALLYQGRVDNPE